MTHEEVVIPERLKAAKVSLLALDKVSAERQDRVGFCPEPKESGNYAVRGH